MIPKKFLHFIIVPSEVEKLGVVLSCHCFGRYSNLEDISHMHAIEGVACSIIYYDILILLVTSLRFSNHFCDGLVRKFRLEYINFASNFFFFGEKFSLYNAHENSLVYINIIISNKSTVLKSFLLWQHIIVLRLQLFYMMM